MSLLPPLRSVVAAVLVAVSAAAGARAQEPSPVALYRSLKTADSLYETGAREAAVDGYEQVVAHRPRHVRAWYRLGRSYEAAERRREAARALGEAHDLGYRFDWWIAQRVAGHYARLGDVDPALEWLSRALAEGYEDRASLESDPRFEALRGDPRFDRLAGIPPQGMGRDEGWRHDLDYLRDEVRRLHVSGPGRPPVPPRFEALADSLHRRIPELEDVDVVLEMQRLVALLGDGHTGIYGPGEASRIDVDFPSLPVLFYRFPGGLYVVDGKGPGAGLVGSRVLRMGGLEPEEVLSRLDPYVHRDNAMTPRWLGVRFYLTSAQHLRAVGVTDDPSSVDLVVEGPDGERRRVTLPTGDHEFRRKLRHPPVAERSPPLWLREVDTHYRFEPLPGMDAVWFQFNQVRDAEKGPPLAAFADTLRRALERTGAGHLVIDVRHNNGGNSGLLGPLVRTLVWWEEEAPGHRIWVVTGRNTFSAAQSFVNHVERWTDAVFVGEPSSSRPNFSGEETALVLPWSGVRGSVSSRYFQDSGPLDGRRWIDVDLAIPLTAEDYFEGRDPVREALASVMTP